LNYLDRFRVEARALGKLQHPNIVQVSDYGIDSRNGDVPYLVMEYLEGLTLDCYLKQQEFLQISQVLPIAESIAGAIDYAHGCGVLHRDLKLQNIFLIGDPSESRVKILDFGLARIADEHGLQEKKSIPAPRPMGEEQRSSEEKSGTLTIAGNPGGDTLELPPEERTTLTQAGSLMGTLGYIAPEIMRGGEAGPASDVFSFGVLIYEMLVGNRPLDVNYSKPLRPSLLRPTVPPELDSVLLTPLEPNPILRPSKAMDVVRRLKQAFSLYRYRVWRAREVPRRIGLAAIVTLALLLLLGFSRGCRLSER
jgi:serine/threonine-protein kinase